MAHLNGISSSRDQTPCDLTEDRISSLPWHVLNIIFSYLPILDAVRTSVLAKDWRYKWLLLSMFVLDSSTIPLGKNTTDRRWDTVAGIVNKYLRHHASPIKKFFLKTNFSSHYPEMCQWIQYLSKQDVEELSIQESSSIGFVAPSHLFSFKNLDKLWLVGAVLRISLDFGGFTSLRTVFFRCVNVNGDYLNRFILSCPKLEKLTLLNIWGVKILRIHAPRLNRLLTDTSVGDIVIEAAPCLATVYVIDVLGEPQRRAIFNSHGAVRSLLSLGSIKELVISGDMIKLLAADYGFENFPWRNTTLTSLMFQGLSFETVEVFDFCLSMLNSCSNVKHFFFSFQSAKGQKLNATFLMQIRGQFSFPELRSLEMKCLAGVGMGCSVNFLEYISAHSPNLKFLTVVKQGGNEMNQTRLSRMVTRLKKTCTQALVRYVHYGQGTSHEFSES